MKLRTLLLSLGLLPCLPFATHATIVTYAFTGTISNNLLMNGSYVDLVGRTSAAWLGQDIQGTVSLDLANAWQTDTPSERYPSTDGSTFNTYGSSWQQPGFWVTATVHQPDGSTFHLPSGIQPISPTADQAYAGLHNEFFATLGSPATIPKDRFSVSRANDGEGFFPYEAFGLDLMSWGPSALIDGVNYSTVHIDPSQANSTNMGHVLGHSGTSLLYDYFFTINSLAVASVTDSVPNPLPVPEPASYAFLGMGVLLLTLKHTSARRLHRSASA